jgi:adenylate cyclase
VAFKPGVVKSIHQFLNTKLRTKLIRSLQALRADADELRTVILAGLVVTGLLLGLRHNRWLQPSELFFYDQIVQLQPDRGPDDRVLLVEITEADIRFVNQWPIPDGVLAKTIEALQRCKARAIGLDLWRDVPVGSGHPALAQQLQADNVYVISLVGTVPPPASFATANDRVAANNVAIDPDGVLRRNLLFPATQDPTYQKFAEDGVFYALALRLALVYLGDRRIYPQASPDNPNYLQLGQAVFVPLRFNDGGYLDIEAARTDHDALGYQLLIDYRSQHQTARQVSLQDLLQKQGDQFQVHPDLECRAVQGKLILIGATAASAKDRFLTPFSVGNRAEEADMSGVEVHAQTISQILDAAIGTRSLMTFWPEWLEIVWMIGWISVGGAIAWWVRHPVGLVASNLVLVSAIAGFTLFFFAQRTWIPIVSPGLGAVLMGITLVAYRAYQSQQQRKMVMKLLGQNTSAAIADALWQDRDTLLKAGKLPGQQLTATILFTDLAGFSTIAEQMHPELLLEWLNEYLAMLTQVVQAHHGVVNKFTGDGIMAVFGVPVPRVTPDEIANDARQAVACALTMRDRLLELNQHWQAQGRSPLKMRVGIYTGAVVAGSLGSKDRLEYGVIGDSVNIASRLESCAKERQLDVCRILIAEETQVHLQEQFGLESWGAIALKGKHQTVTVYRVIDRQLDHPDDRSV